MHALFSATLACCLWACATGVLRIPHVVVTMRGGGDAGSKKGRSLSGAPTRLTSLTSRQTQIVNFLSGGLAGTVSSTLTLPLEVIKTQLQSSRLGSNSGPLSVARLVFQTGGLRGFFKGIKPLLIGIIPTRAIYFWAYGSTKASLTPSLGNGPVNHLLSAFAAGITSNTIMNPWWMVKTRFQIIADKSVGQVQFKNYGDLVKLIWKEEGIAGFYKGVVASYVGCVEGAIQWIVYEKVKDVLQLTANRRVAAEGGRGNTGGSQGAGANKGKDGKGEVRPEEFFAAAALSKTVAILLTYPHEVVRTRMREQAVNGVYKYKGFVNTLRLLAREEGFRGCYSGMGIHLARSVPNAAVMFLVFELTSKVLARGVEVQRQ